jgi:hypothetical protein
MGTPTSEVSYPLATTRRGDHEVYIDMWWHWGKKKFECYNKPDYTIITLLDTLSDKTMYNYVH